MKINLTPSWIFKMLCLLIIILVALGLATTYMELNFDQAMLQQTWNKRFIKWFNLDNEFTMSCYFSSAALLLAAVLLFLISRKQKKISSDHRYWMGLSVIFAYLAVDEFIEIHGYLTSPLKSRFHLSGFFQYAWVIPFGILGLVLLLLYIRFLNRLPNKIRNLILLSGFVYVSGALGLEMLGGEIQTIYGHESAIYRLTVTLEETLEMFGTALFIYTLLLYISENFDGIKIYIGGQAKANTV